MAPVLGGVVATLTGLGAVDTCDVGVPGVDGVSLGVLIATVTDQALRGSAGSERLRCLLVLPGVDSHLMLVTDQPRVGVGVFAGHRFLLVVTAYDRVMRTYWHMSFVDTEGPDGDRWLGGLNTEADTFAEALTWSHVSGLNPGGEIQFVGIHATGLDPNYVDRLITDPAEWRAQPMPENPVPLDHTEEAMGDLNAAVDVVSTPDGRGPGGATPAGDGDDGSSCAGTP